MPDPGEISQSLEDYVEAIAFILKEGRSARIREIADRLEVKRPSATGAVAQLVERGLALHEPYGEVELTPAGTSLAAKLVRRHETITDFLHQVLGVERDLAEADACRLEHAMSKETFRCFEEFYERLRSEGVEGRP